MQKLAISRKGVVCLLEQYWLAIAQTRGWVYASKILQMLHDDGV